MISKKQAGQDQDEHMYFVKDTGSLNIILNWNTAVK